MRAMRMGFDRGFSRLSDRVGGGGGEKTLEIVGTANGTGTNSATVTYPSGMRPGDIVFGAVISGSAPPTPSGYVASSTAINGMCFAREVTGSEGSGLTVTGSGNTAGVIACIRNAKPNTLLHGMASTTAGPGSLFSLYTYTAAENQLVAVWAQLSVTIFPPAGVIEIAQASVGSTVNVHLYLSSVPLIWDGTAWSHSFGTGSYARGGFMLPFRTIP